MPKKPVKKPKKTKPAIGATFCMYCGAKNTYTEGDGDSFVAAWQAGLTHDLVCSENPLVKKLEMYKKWLAEADASYDKFNKEEKWYQRILAFAVASGFMMHLEPPVYAVLQLVLALGIWYLGQLAFEKVHDFFWPVK